MTKLEWCTTTEAMQRTGLSHTAVMQAVGRGTLNGTSIDGRVLVTSSSIERLVKAMAPAAAIAEGSRS